MTAISATGFGTRPGMCYLVAPGINEARYAMPVRTFLIDDADMRAHAAAHPASARPLDAVTVKAAGDGYANRGTVTLAPAPTGGDDDEVSPLEEHMRTEDPSPEIQAGMDDPIEDDPDDEEFTFDRPARGKVSTEEARAALRRRRAHKII